MTTEEGTTFDMPGDIQYSMIRNIPAYEAPEFYAKVFESFQEAREAREQTFSQPVEEDEAEQSATYRAPRQRAPARQARQQQQRDYGVTLQCPEHGATLQPSLKNKTMDVDEETGREIPASWWHTTEDGKSCSVWRSRAVVVE